MPRARKKLIDLASTSYYHLISRCVRRVFLCGDDKYTGQNFDHRREWLVERVKLLSSVFSIDIEKRTGTIFLANGGSNL